MKINKIIFLIDGRTSFLKDFWVHKFFLESGYNYKFIGLDSLRQKDLDENYRIPILHLKYIRAALSSILKSSKKDLIIVWLDKMGIYTFLWSIILFRRRQIIILNIMAPNTNSISSKLRNFIYHLCLKNKNSFATVNNSKLIDLYIKDLKVKGDKFFVLKDSIHDFSDLVEPYRSGDDYVFFGGSGGRDFNLMITIAKRLPKIPFVFVVKKKYFSTMKTVSHNVRVFYDISLEEFNEKLSKSNLVVLPIKVDTPAGILVLITAGLKSKMVISSNTVSISEYIKHNFDGILLDNLMIEKWTECIEQNFTNERQQRKFGQLLQSSILKITSNQNYQNNLENIIKSVSGNRNFKLHEDITN